MQTWHYCDENIQKVICRLILKFINGQTPQMTSATSKFKRSTTIVLRNQKLVQKMFINGQSYEKLGIPTKQELRHIFQMWFLKKI